MTGGDIFYNTFNKHWFEWKEKNKKGIKFVNVRRSKYIESSNTMAIIVDLKKEKIKITTISYYKLFNDCTVVEDEETLKKLLVTEAKMLLKE